MYNIRKGVIVFLFLIFLCSCSEQKIKLSEEVVLDVEISPSDQTIMELSTKIYSDIQLEEIVEFKGNINELNDLYPIECIRENHDYYVSYLGESQVVVLIYDVTGNWIMGNIYNITKSRSDFADIKEGCTLEDVQVVDPNGLYGFLYTGKDWPKLSEHCTYDGYIIQIQYDRENTIINITEELI